MAAAAVSWLLQQLRRGLSDKLAGGGAVAGWAVRVGGMRGTRHGSCTQHALSCPDALCALRLPCSHAPCALHYALPQALHEAARTAKREVKAAQVRHGLAFECDTLLRHSKQLAAAHWSAQGHFLSLDCALFFSPARPSSSTEATSSHSSDAPSLLPFPFPSLSFLPHRPSSSTTTSTLSLDVIAAASSPLLPFHSLPLPCQALIFHDDLKARKRVLGRLGYLDEQGVVTVKVGRGGANAPPCRVICVPFVAGYAWLVRANVCPL